MTSGVSPTLLGGGLRASGGSHLSLLCPGYQAGPSRPASLPPMRSVNGSATFQNMDGCVSMSPSWCTPFASGVPSPLGLAASYWAASVGHGLLGGCGRQCRHLRVCPRHTTWPITIPSLACLRDLGTCLSVLKVGVMAQHLLIGLADPPLTFWTWSGNSGLLALRPHLLGAVVPAST